MEAIAALGFVATVFTFLTEQVVYLKRIYYTFADFEYDIKRYAEQVKACEGLVKEWHRIWGDSFSQEPELYKDLWGDAGFTSTKVNLKLLTKQIDRCLKLLRLKCGLKEPDFPLEPKPKSVRRWIGLSETTKTRRSDVAKIHNITYSLWNNQEIHHQFENARVLANDLATSTEQFFRAKGHIADGVEVTESYVSLCKNNIRTGRFASALYEIFWRNRQDVEFLLTLRLPENDRKPQHFELVRRPRLDFAISFRVHYDGSKYRSERYYTIRQDPDPHRDISGKDIQTWHVEDFIELQDYAEISFEGLNYYVKVRDKEVPQYQCIRRKMDGRSKLSRQRNVQVTDYMVDASLGLSSVTLWFILFHKSGWFGHLHGSRLHRISSNENGIEEAGAVSIGGRTYMFRPWTLREASQYSGQNPVADLFRDKLLLLGATIGELVLGHKVGLYDKDGVPYFVLRKNNRLLDLKATFFGDLVEEEASLDMAEAIGYCIKERDCHSFRMEEFQRKVINPIWEYQSDFILPAPILSQA